MRNRVLIRCEGDVMTAVVAVQAEARQLGFSEPSIAKLATAVSELTRNIHKYAAESGGDVLIYTELLDDRLFLMVQARDNGPGIADLERAMSEHFSTSGTLGLGLPGVRRLVDTFEIHSVPGEGTVVTVGVERDR